MTKIAILSCLNASSVCSGAACFKAVNDRTKSFEIYKEEDVEIIAFFHCNGCSCDYENDIEYKEKIDTVIKLKPDAVNIGKCTVTDGCECSIITKIAATISDSGIRVIRGTH